MRAVVIASLALTLAGCGLSAQIEAQKQTREALARHANMLAECTARYPFTPTTAVQFANCANAADAEVQRIIGQSDLIGLRMAKRSEVAERVANRVITPTQGVLEITQLQTSLVSEMERRTLAERGIAAQEQAAANVGGPHTCTSYGNTVRCY